MIKRSAAVVLTVTIQHLFDGRIEELTADQELCLQALRRSNEALRTASNEDLSDYIRSLSPEQLRGVVSNVKGKFHEMLVERAEDTDGDGIGADLFPDTNHPGADLEFLMDGEVIREVQLKAVQSPTAIVEHFSKYPEIDVMATSEVYAALEDAFSGQVTESGFSNVELTRMTEDTFAALRAEGLAEVMQDGVITSTLVAGALQARAMLSGRPVDAATMRSALEAAGIGIATAVAMEALLETI